jgi:Glycosyl transferases group 1
LPLRIAAKVDRVDRTYFHEEIEPLLVDPLVEYIGEIGDADKADFLGNARAILFPIDWPEPFGLVMIEAMACGTPVVAWHCGSVAEVVDHNTTGFIVESIEEAVAAVHRTEHIDRRRVRGVFEERFTAEVMAHNYLQLYWRLLGTRAQSRKLMPEAAEQSGVPTRLFAHSSRSCDDPCGRLDGVARLGSETLVAREGRHGKWLFGSMTRPGR